MLDLYMVASSSLIGVDETRKFYLKSDETHQSSINHYMTIIGVKTLWKS